MIHPSRQAYVEEQVEVSPFLSADAHEHINIDMMTRGHGGASLLQRSDDGAALEPRLMPSSGCRRWSRSGEHTYVQFLLSDEEEFPSSIDRSARPRVRIARHCRWYSS